MMAVRRMMEQHERRLERRVPKEADRDPAQVRNIEM